MSKKEIKPVSLEEARSIFTAEAIQKISDTNGWGKIVERWPYHDQKGDIIGLDIEFEKLLKTFWFDGKNIRHEKSPVLIYNLPEVVKSEKPILITSSARAAEAARTLEQFTPCSWSGGGNNPDRASWKFLKRHEVYIYHSDDDPGFANAGKIRAKLFHARIIRPLPVARDIKPEGADIEEALQSVSPDELTFYILNNYVKIESPDTGPENPPESANSEDLTPPHSGPVSGDSMPFEILGIGDDGKSAFITEAGRLVRYGLDSLGKNKLMVLANRCFWKNEYANRNGSVSWDDAVDDVIRLAQFKDFNDSDVRGRGAWRDGDKISYHDGVKTYGEYDPDKIYLRLPRKKIGIEDDSANPELRRKMKDLVFKLSFETRSDAVRCLAWTSLAPYAGAMIYRPSMLLTGSSGTGKTEIQKLVMRPMGLCEWFDTRVTTTAGVRSTIGRDSTSVIFDEAGKENEKQKSNFNDILAFIRSNYSVDSPDGVKGTKDGGHVNYKMNSMFALASTDPTIENIQDENRILRINFVIPKMTAAEWQNYERELKNLFSVENCRKVRSYVWKNLKQIDELTYRIVVLARSKTSRDYRSSYAEMLLASAFMIVWAGIENPTDAQINDTLDKYYKFQPAEEHRDEAGEFVDRILEEHIEILHDGSREKISVLECMNRIGTNGNVSGDDDIYHPDKINNYRKTLSRHGIRVDGKGVETGEIAIAINHHAIMKMTKYMTGYNRIFERHRWFVDTKNIYFLDGKTRRSTILRGLLLKKTEDDKLEGLMF